MSSNAQSAREKATFIHNAIAEIAEANHVPLGLLVGAGASAAVGLPTTTGFSEAVLADEHQEALRRDEAKISNSTQSGLLANLIRSVGSADGWPVDTETVLDHIERCLEAGGSPEASGHLVAVVNSLGEEESWSPRLQDVAARVEDFRGKWVTAHRRLSEVRTYVRQSLYDVYGQPPDPVRLQKVWEVLWSFLPRLDTLPVFTTNYDIVFEELERQFCMPKGLELHLGLEPDESAERYRWSADRMVQEVDGKLLVHKLHGSVNWCLDDDVVWSRGRDVCDDTLSPARMALEFPVLRKTRPQGWSQEMYSLLEAWLSVIPTWLVIGFSFRDEQIRQMFEAAVDAGSVTQIFAVAPKLNEADEAGTLNANLEALLSREAASGSGAVGLRIEHGFGTDECWEHLTDELFTYLQ